MFMATQFFDALCARGATDDRPLVDADAVATDWGMDNDDLIVALETLEGHALIESFERAEGGLLVRLSPYGLSHFRQQPERLAQELNAQSV